MSRYRSLLAAGMTTVVALPALAQQAPAPGAPFAPYYGYGHMWGWHPVMMLFGGFGMLIVLVVAVLLVLGLARCFGFLGCHGCLHFGRGRGGAALDILEERFARGEIGKEEFEEKRKLIGR